MHIQYLISCINAKKCSISIPLSNSRLKNILLAFTAVSFFFDHTNKNEKKIITRIQILL